MTKEEAKKFGLHLLQGIMERNESYPVYANNVKQAIDALSEQSCSSEIPNDLEEAADEYKQQVTEETKCHHNALTYAEGYEDALLLIPDAFITGAKWQKEQKPVRWKKDEEALLGGLLHKTGLSPDERFFLENLRPSWKPSKTQIMALEQWLKNHRFDGAARYIYPIFESLFNGLKTL